MISRLRNSTDERESRPASISGVSCPKAAVPTNSETIDRIVGAMSDAQMDVDAPQWHWRVIRLFWFSSVCVLCVPIADRKRKRKETFSCKLLDKSTHVGCTSDYDGALLRHSRTLRITCPNSSIERPNPLPVNAKSVEPARPTPSTAVTCIATPTNP